MVPLHKRCHRNIHQQLWSFSMVTKTDFVTTRVFASTYILFSIVDNEGPGQSAFAQTALDLRICYVGSFCIDRKSYLTSNDRSETQVMAYSQGHARKSVQSVQSINSVMRSVPRRPTTSRDCKK